MYHPDVILSHAHGRQRELIADGEWHRVISAIRRHNRAQAASGGRRSVAMNACGAAVMTPA
jgi:hypothetical protein